MNSFIGYHRENGTNPVDLASRLSTLGSNYTDMYCGDLDLTHLCMEIEKELLIIDVVEPHKFQSWLNTDGRDYKELRLSDGSRWTLRWGHTDRYIHFHPSRDSYMVKRLKSNALKTAIFYLLYFRHKAADLKLINQLREQYFKLSPVKYTNAFYEAHAMLKK